MAERWEIAYLKFGAEETNSEYVNSELAKCPGWEPFDSYWDKGIWVLLIRRKVKD